jgi:signal transduction histidine kinase
MNWDVRAGDTITRRFVATLALAFAATFAMNWAFVAFAGVWGQPSLASSGVLDRAATVVRIMEALPREQRAAIAAAGSTEQFPIVHYSEAGPLRAGEAAHANFHIARDRMRELLDDPARPVVFFTSRPAGASHWKLADAARGPATKYHMGVALADGGWTYFTATQRSWGIPAYARRALELGFVVLSIAISAMLTARYLARPVQRFTEAVRRFGNDPQAPPIPVAGPLELRVTIEAFNAMQEQIRSFVADRTAMLAAISHDLRTPLTRMRLRGEFIEDADQQRKLFRDVDEMQQMVDSALAFFQDEAGQEERTSFDMVELLRSVVDDYADQGIPLAFESPDRLVQVGRPLALRRVFVNLIDNAIKYATPPALALTRRPGGLRITVRDRGRGLPEGEIEKVFAPFYRLSPSRSRATGGVGLGLTAARSILRAHGGDLRLLNCPEGGLEAQVDLPDAP